MGRKTDIQHINTEEVLSSTRVAWANTGTYHMQFQY